MPKVYVVSEVGEYSWDTSVLAVYPEEIGEMEMKARVEHHAHNDYDDNGEAWEWTEVGNTKTEWNYAYDNGCGDNYGYIVSLMEVEA